MEIILASANRHKQREIAEILAPARILTPDDCGVRFDFEETGSSFLENALGKALHLHSLTGEHATLADDSGLIVPALDGAPGIYSARYGEDSPRPPANDRERYELLLERMLDIEDRRAMFVCCIVLVFESHRFSVVQETFHGEIARTPSGDGGFGYDPVFFIPEEQKSAAELTAMRKNEISHRAKALARIKAIVDGI